jgi:hypothetical protein
MQNDGRASPIRKTLLVALLAAIGCSSADQQLADLSRQSADRQAGQNRLVETNNQQVIDAARKLVEADAQGRKENLELHRQIESERMVINQQRDTLEQERRELAHQRNRDPIIANTVMTVAGLLAAILPLVACIYLLRGLFHKSDDAALADVLIEELVAERPLLVGPEQIHLSANSAETAANPTSPENQSPD